MELDAYHCIRILNKNFKLQIKKDPDFGKTIILPAREAYFYSLIEKAPYLLSESRGLSPFGKLDRIFNFVSKYTLNSGALNDLNEEGGPIIINSPKEHIQKAPLLFEGRKTILFIELEDSSEEPLKKREIYKILKKRGDNPSNFLITFIHKEHKGYKMEHFCEYVCCRYLKERGYITLTQLNLDYNKGKPDICAIKDPILLNKFNKFFEKGFYLAELSSLFLLDKKGKNEISKEKELLIGDAKTSSSSAVLQLEKYLSSNYFNKAFEFIPHLKNAKKGFGLFYFKEDFSINYVENKIKILMNEEHQERFLEWITNLSKIYLFLNLDISEIKRVFSKKSNKEWNSKNFVSFIQSLKIEDILKILEKYGTNI